MAIITQLAGIGLSVYESHRYKVLVGCSCEEVQLPNSATSSNRKEYVYHPDPRVNEALGNDVPSICLACCHLFESDTLDPRTCCMKCKSEKIIPCFDLAGKVCPKCGDLPLQVEGGAIS